jgi:hypothetical protein
MEHLNRFVSSRGLLRSCAVHNAQPESSRDFIDQEIVDHCVSCESVYVCTDAVVTFARDVFPKLKSAFSLLTGDSDGAVTAQLIEQPAVYRMLASSKLSGWWAQNCAVSHPKLHFLPIGNDYHTMWEFPGVFSHLRLSPVAQESLLYRVLAESPPIEERYLVGYCNWLPTIDRGDRRECYLTIDQSALLVEPSRVPREVSWSRQASCMFVVSPEGAGMDCHRTWEALMLGCIPIIRKNALTSLFDDLPVWVVQDWSEVNKDSMREFALQSVVQRYDFSRLFLRYWQDQVHGRPSVSVGTMTRSQFREYLVGNSIT